MKNQSEREVDVAFAGFQTEVDWLSEAEKSTYRFGIVAAIAALDAHRQAQRAGDDEIVEAMCVAANLQGSAAFHREYRKAMRAALAVARRMDGSARDAARLAWLQRITIESNLVRFATAGDKLFLQVFYFGEPKNHEPQADIRACIDAAMAREGE